MKQYENYPLAASATPLPVGLEPAIITKKSEVNRYENYPVTSESSLPLGVEPTIIVTTRNQAVLPTEQEAHTIDKMSIGESAFIVPWGMWVDDTGRCWLHPKYTAHISPGGTVSMKIERREDGFHVWVKGSKHRWTRSSRPGYASPADTVYIPVSQIH